MVSVAVDANNTNRESNMRSKGMVLPESRSFCDVVCNYCGRIHIQTILKPGKYIFRPGIPQRWP